MKKKIGLMFVGLVFIFVAVGCRESSKVSYNVSKEADNFNVIRRVAVINTITDKVEFEVVGRIAIDKSNSETLKIVVEAEKGIYKKHYINLTQLNMYVVEDLEGAKVNQYKYEVNYMPESIVPFEVTESK